jgi:hypothetical protein
MRARRASATRPCCRNTDAAPSAADTIGRLEVQMRRLAGFLLAAGLSACQSNGTGVPDMARAAAPTYRLGGTASGVDGTGLVLATDGGDTLTIEGDGPFAFPTQLADGTGYSVSIAADPQHPNQTCTVENGSGVIDAADITDINVTCTTNTYTVGGEAFGLAGQVVLQIDAGNEMLTLAGNGVFHFPTALPDGTVYTVSVLSAPTSPKQNCALTNPMGVIDGDDVRDLVVTCLNDKFTVGGTVVGLSGTLVLQNGGDELTLTGDGPFTFPGRTPGGSYAVTVKTQPANRLCAVFNGGGTVPWFDSAPVSVVCMAPVAPRYANAPNWNDYVKSSDTTMACAGDEPTWWSCLHGGERRQVLVPGKSDCTGLSASDDLNAFDWKCVTGPVRFVSWGLRDDKRLADLLDWDGLAWKPNRVVVRDGARVLPTPTSTWWSNPVVVATPPANGDNDTVLNSPGTVYVVKNTADPTCVTNYSNRLYDLQADRAAFVVHPAIELRNPSCIREALLYHNYNHRFIWVEGRFHSDGGSAINASNAAFAVYRYIDNPNNCFDSANLVASSVFHLRCHNYSVTFNSIDGSLIRDVTNRGSNDRSLYYAGTTSVISGAEFSGGNEVMLAGNNQGGNVFSRLLATGSQAVGMEINYGSPGTLLDVTVADSGSYGMEIFRSGAVVFANVASLNAAYIGMDIDVDTTVSTYDVVSAYNGQAGLYLGNAGVVGLAAHGRLWVGQNATSGSLKQCEALTGAVGLVDGTCTTTGAAGSTSYGSGSSDAVFSPTVGDGSYFAGPVGSAVAFSSVTDFTQYADALRFYQNNVAFPNPSSRGQCASGNCILFDWSLRQGDAILRGVHTLPTGNDTIEHRWNFTAANQADCSVAMPGARFVAANDCRTTYLRNAIEAFNDGIGNDNSLCESGETCIFSPNLGAYQGHGDLISAGAFTDGTITGVTLLKYANNGR